MPGSSRPRASVFQTYAGYSPFIIAKMNWLSIVQYYRKALAKIVKQIKIFKINKYNFN